MSTEITINQDQIDINVDTTVVTIEAPQGGYPLPNNVYSVFGRIGNVVAQEGDYNLTQLGDVTITSPTTGQALVYNGTSWVNNTESYVGTVTSVNATVPTGMTISGNPITTAGTLAFGLASGYSIPTTANQATWTTAYNDSIVSAAVTGTTSKVLTLNQQDGGTITATWSDLQPVTSVFGRTGDVVAQSGDYNTLQVTENTNLYFTDQRARYAISGDATSGVVYQNTTGIIALDDIPNTSLLNDSVTVNGSTVALGGSTSFTTTAVTEGTNLYYTDTRARAAITGTAPISVTSGVVSISQSGPSTNGYLSSADWNTFNGKQSALTFGNLTSSDITVTGGTGAVIGSGSTMTLATVNSNVGTYGSSTAIPVITVNGKGLVTAVTTDAVFIPSGALSFIGDVTGTGNTGSDTTLTLATVNSNVGAYGSSTSVPTITVNAKGLVTAASQTAIPTSSGSTTGLLTSSDWTTFNAKQAQLNGTGFVKVSGTTVSYDNSTYLTTIEGIAAGGELSGTYASPSLVNSAVTGKVLTGLNVTGGTVVDTDSILTAFGKVQNQINGLIGGSIYQGTWNASTNTPILVSSVGVKGYYYIVSVAGSTNLNGITDWNVGDWVIFDGLTWQKVDNTDAVVSVNGYTGAVSLTTSDISEGTNQYFTTSRARQSVSAGTGISYDNSTGVITNSAPDQTVSLTASTGISTSGTYPNFTITNTAPDQTVSLTASTGISTSGTYPNFTITNTAPDQTVSLTGAGTTSITGTYPNFTVTSNDQYVGTVTSVGITESAAALTITGSPVTTSGNINIGFAGASTDYVAGDGSLVPFPTVVTQAQNLVTQVYNETGATLTKGTIVYVNGGHGNLPTVTKAIATSDLTSAQTYGVVRTDITNNNNGYVTVIGNIDNIDTQAYAAGTQLYLSGTTAGAWTSTKPYAPIHLVYVGIVVRSHPTQGVVEIRIQNGYEMDELHNVSAQSPNNGDILQYVSSTSLWTSVAGSTSNISEGSNLYFTDARARGAISLTTTGNNGASTYNSTTGVLNVPTYTLAGLGGINLTSLSATSPLLYDNTTGVFSIQQANGSQAGYLSSADWTTFEGKQGAITLTTTGSSGASTFSAGTLNIPTYTLSGLGGVPTSRTITINGTSQDLSANQTWTIPTAVNATNTQDYTATAAQTTFTVTGGYTVGQLAVYYNGSKLAAAEYTATNGTTFTLATACQANDIVQAVAEITGGGIGGSGTTNYLSKWTASGVIGNSIISESGTGRINLYASSGFGELYIKGASSTTGMYLFDNNTESGLWKADSGYMAFATNNTERLRLESTGNIQITTNNVALTQKNAAGTGTIGLLRVTAGDIVQIGDGGTANPSTIWFPNGNIGINTNAPINKLDVRISSSTAYSSNSAGNILTLYNTSTTTGAYAGIDFIAEPTSGNAGRAAINMIVTGSGTGDLAFSTRNSTMSERMRVSATGFLKVSNTGAYFTATTTPVHEFKSDANDDTFRIFNSNTSYSSALIQARGSRNTTNASWYFLQCYNDGSGLNKLLIADSGNVTNTNGSYGPFSDIKLKENIVDTTPKLDKLMQVRIVNYNLIGDELKQIGVIAQELEQVFPGLVDEHTDKDSEGNDLGTTTKSVKMSIFVPMLIKAMQEQQTMISELSAKVTQQQEQINQLINK